MHFKVITAAAPEPITLAEAKLHLRFDGSDQDALITSLITAAREAAEHYTDRALAPQTLEMALDAFPAADIELARSPVSNIVSVKYTDTAGIEQTLAPSNYALSVYGEARRLSLAFGAAWPVVRPEADAVRVRYVTGYVVCPLAARAAMLLMIGHLFENRESVDMPDGAKHLLNTVKAWSL